MGLVLQEKVQLQKWLLKRKISFINFKFSDNLSYFINYNLVYYIQAFVDKSLTTSPAIIIPAIPFTLNPI